MAAHIKSTLGPLFAFGLGVGTRYTVGQGLLEVYYPRPSAPGDQVLARAVATVAEAKDRFSPGVNCSVELSNDDLAKIICELGASGEGYPELGTMVMEFAPGGNTTILATFLVEDSPPTTMEEVYLKLSLLSHRIKQPHHVNLEGMFKLLPNVAWTSQGAMHLSDVPRKQLEARLAGTILEVYSVDKFPKMLNHVVPSEVRVADGARVRLGAYLGAGTTIMHEGFVNFNAGTEGPNMVEGRISAGVFVGAGSDLGGGSSTMGTLSGGGKEVITIGRDCLIGANSGTGIPLGDNCIVEAGLYLTAGAKVRLLNESGEMVEELRARDLAKKPGLLFRRNSLTGAIEALPNNAKVELNPILHTNKP